MLRYTDLKEDAVIRFSDAYKLMGERLKEKFTYLASKCTYPSTWDQEQLEDAVDRYQRSENPCDAVDNMVDGEFYFLISHDSIITPLPPIYRTRKLIYIFSS